MHQFSGRAAIAAMCFVSVSQASLVEQVNVAPGSYSALSGWTINVPCRVEAGSLSHPSALASAGNRFTGFSSGNYRDMPETYSNSSTLWASFLCRFDTQFAFTLTGASLFLHEQSTANTTTFDTVEISAGVNRLRFRANGNTTTVFPTVSSEETHLIVVCKTFSSAGMDEWRVWLDPDGALGTPLITRVAPAFDYGRVRISVFAGNSGNPNPGNQFDELRIGGTEASVWQVPAPSTGGVLCMAGLAAYRRRRRRQRRLERRGTHGPASRHKPNQLSALQPHHR